MEREIEARGRAVSAAVTSVVRAEELINAISNRLSQLCQFHQNVYLVYVSTFVVGFLWLGGVYNVLVNLLVVRMGFGPEFVGLVNGSIAIAFSLGSLCAPALRLRFPTLLLIRVGTIGFSVGFTVFLSRSIFQPTGTQVGLLRVISLPASWLAYSGFS